MQTEPKSFCSVVNSNSEDGINLGFAAILPIEAPVEADGKADWKKTRTNYQESCSKSEDKQIRDYRLRLVVKAASKVLVEGFNKCVETVLGGSSSRPISHYFEHTHDPKLVFYNIHMADIEGHSGFDFTGKLVARDIRCDKLDTVGIIKPGETRRIECERPLSGAMIYSTIERPQRTFSDGEGRLILPPLPPIIEERILKQGDEFKGRAEGCGYWITTQTDFNIGGGKTTPKGTVLEANSNPDDRSYLRYRMSNNAHLIVYKNNLAIGVAPGGPSGEVTVHEVCTRQRG